jgi:SAM-dependent methyltransferase
MLNWLGRYAPAGAAVLDDAGRLQGSMLDVGCGPHGFACAHPDVPFVGLDVEFPLTVARSMTAIQAPAGPLPFQDGAFDTVLSLDTLEHVPRPDRAAFVAELARAAARRVLLACPTAEGAGVDAAIRSRFESMGVPVPSWLSEHDEHVLPTREEIEAMIGAVPGFSVRPCPMANGLIVALLAWADMFEFGAEARREFLQHREEWVRLLEGATFGTSFRGAWLLERTAATTPLIGVERLEDDTIAALRCLSCGAGHERQDGAVARCTGCGAVVSRTPENAWKVSGAPSPRTDVLLAPTWEEPATWLPVLEAYIRLGGDDTTLYLDAGTTTLSPDIVAAVVQEACDELAGDRPFAEVVLLAAGEPPPDAIRVQSSDELAASLA